MDENQMDKILHQVKDQIPINIKLKEELRQSFTTQQRPKRRWMRLVSAAAAIVLLAGVINLYVSKDERVAAASLQIKEYVSYAELVWGVAATEYNDTVYSIVSGKGLYAYDRAGFHLLTDHQADDLKISPDGKRLLWGYKGTVGIFNIAGRSWDIIKKVGSGEYYKQPSWIDDQSILYVEQNSSKIIELQLDQHTAHELANGTFPSIVHHSDVLVFQKDTANGPQVVQLNLKSQRVQVIDSGREPSVSPLGQYVAYIKTEGKPASRSMTSHTQTGIDNVWISDIDGNSQRAVTDNMSQHEAVEKGFFGINSSNDSDQVGLYQFNLPVWSSDSAGIFVFKKRLSESTANLTRIGLSKTALGPEQLIASFNEAMIYKNYDYAQSLLLGESSELIMGSNPIQISYTITGSGTVDGKKYVDTEEKWVYTANPYMLTRNMRYNVIKDNRGYRIDSIKLLDSKKITQMEGGPVQREHGSTQESLFATEDIPQNILPAGSSRIATLYSLSDSDDLWFTVQALGRCDPWSASIRTSF